MASTVQNLVLITTIGQSAATQPRLCVWIAQPGELCAMKQSPSSKIHESKLWNIKEQFGRRGSTSQQPQHLAMWQLLSRL